MFFQLSHTGCTFHREFLHKTIPFFFFSAGENAALQHSHVFVVELTGVIFLFWRPTPLTNHPSWAATTALNTENAHAVRSAEHRPHPTYHTTEFWFISTGKGHGKSGMDGNRDGYQLTTHPGTRDRRASSLLSHRTSHKGRDNRQEAHSNDDSTRQSQTTAPARIRSQCTICMLRSLRRFVSVNLGVEH